ncbi:MAG: hypothetical protein M3Y46_06575 [Actinomycetota bacterium]|nr:hypothetical protein [Actinomycetota bacterium]
MNSQPRTRPVLRAALWTGAAILVAALLFAPIGVSGSCIDGPSPEATACTTVGRSLVESRRAWLWLGATVVLSALAWWLARVRR